jgi:hypothetical protein
VGTFGNIAATAGLIFTGILSDRYFDITPVLN